jgi:NADH-quinone oxidoreductase subunit E
MTTTLQLSDKTLADIARNIAKYPPEQKQSAVMASLIAAQTEVGWVSPEVIATIAQILEMPMLTKWLLSTTCMTPSRLVNISW